MIQRLVAALLLGLVAAWPGYAQIDGLLPLDDPVHRFLERQHAAGHLPGSFLSHQPLSAYEAQAYLDSLAARRGALSGVDRRLLARYRYETPGPNAPWVNERVPWLYANGRDLFSARTEDFAVQVGPLLYLRYGRARQTERGDRAAWITTWENTRGVRAAGHLDLGRSVHLFFDTRVEESQRRDPLAPPFSKKTAPRRSRVQFYDNIYDYNHAAGGIGLRSEHFEVRFGRWRNQWGPGASSLLLSDYAPPYDQLQIRTSVWRLQYTNLFTALTDLTFIPPGQGYPDQELPRRYGAFHRLAIQLPGRVQLGLSEGVLIADRTVGNRQKGFDPSFLNPLIFYRAVHLHRGSPGNLLVGADLSWNALPGLQLYGEAVADEFVAEEMFTSSWRNKWGGLVGLHLAGIPLSTLSLRLEYARLRPFLYTHREPATAYLHYDDPLGHPAGPNAWDIALLLDYQVTPELHTALNLAYTVQGRNTDSLNVGADPRISYDERFSDDVPFLSGVRQSKILLEAHAEYELLPRLWLEAALRYEARDDDEHGLDRYLAPSLALRWNRPFRSVRY